MGAVGSFSLNKVDSLWAPAEALLRVSLGELNLLPHRTLRMSF